MKKLLFILVLAIFSQICLSAPRNENNDKISRGVNAVIDNPMMFITILGTTRHMGYVQLI